MRQAVILAGGKGTRLRSVLGDLPKPLADVGGEPLLGHQLRLLRRHGFDEVVLLVNEGAESIKRWAAGPDVPDIRIHLVDDGTPRGTAGAVLAALDQLAPEFLVMYGDTMLGVDLSRFWAWHHVVPGTAASLFLHPNDHPQDSDLVEQDAEGRILRFHPYPHRSGGWFPNLVNAALYVVNREALLSWRDLPAPLDFGKNLFPKMVEAGQLLRGYVSSEYIKDAGTPARLDKVRRALESGIIARASLDQPQKAVFIDRDGTLSEDFGHIKSPETLEVFPFVGPALHRLNESEWRAIVITNQPVLARGEATEADLRSIHAKLDSVVAMDHAFFDRLYYCPHHPDRGFAGEVVELKHDCDCRKPKPGMIWAAQADFNVNLAESWFVGDSTADLGAAEEACVSSILVRTGSGGLDDKYPYEPGFSVGNFAEAVDFILGDYQRVAGIAAPIVSRVGPGQDWFVGGLARSGKSTFAAALARELRLRNMPAAVIQLDRWILSPEDRRDGVVGRYDVAGIEATCRKAAERGAGQVDLALPFYSRRLRRRLHQIRNLRVAPGQVLIWEGTIAIEIAGRLGLLSNTVHLETAAEGRRSRFFQYDARRGVDPDISRKNWAAREVDEHPVVSALSASARFPINLDNAFEPMATVGTS